MLSALEYLKDSNEKILKKAKLRLISESCLYLTPERKAVLSRFPLLEKEKIKSVTLFTNENIQILLCFALTSFGYDLIRKRKRVIILNLIGSTAFRLLILNCFYYLFLIDYDKFYSNIYYKQQKKN